MYEAGEVLANFERNLFWILVFTLIAWTTGFVQIVEAIRLGARDRLPGAPIGMTGFLLAHDFSYFLRHEHWFHTVDHWFFELMWYGMGIAVLIELVIVSQFLRFGRQALAPRLSAAAFAGLYLLFQVAAFVTLWWVQSLIDDPLYLTSLVATQIAAVIFNIPFLLNRGSARGQSRTFAWATLLGPGSLAMGMFPALSPFFRNGLYAALCLTLIALSLAYLLLLERYRREPAPAS
jgi:hypothetical protein